MKQRSQTKQAGNIVLSGVVVVLVIVVLALVGIGIKHRRNLKQAAVITPPAVIQTTTPAAPTGPLASGTTNQNLTTDLSNVNGSLNQSSQSLQTSNSSVNDQQQQIAVPTN